MRLSVFAILPARVFFRAGDFKVRTSAVVQDRRLPFFIIRFLRVVGAMRVSRVTRARKVNFGLDIDQSVENRPPAMQGIVSSDTRAKEII